MEAEIEGQRGLTMAVAGGGGRWYWD